MRATKVGIREFRSGLAEFIASANPVALTRHGQTVGYFIPAHGNVDADLAALTKASAEFDRSLTERSVDLQPVATGPRAAHKAGKPPARKSAGPRR